VQVAPAVGAGCRLIIPTQRDGKGERAEVVVDPRQKGSEVVYLVRLLTRGVAVEVLGRGQSPGSSVREDMRFPRG